ncbi:limonene hydroxylase [Paenibacillus ottowii]|uniref:Limonene hydroxylase n=1 Tax=Paenibacillus ottowii TaxID=2315729 RepID=A0ABY3B952_9BACL|nr:limonene hydroxylase [Paenibacillus ottowii]TQS00877.1 limonene hydroxylase [Paenibacillus ottowii]
MFGRFKNEVLYPWVGKLSIYETIKQGLDSQGRLVDDQLPDDEEYWAGHTMRWVAGGLDGAFGHHGAGGDGEAEKVKDLAQLLSRQCRKPGMKTRRETYIRLMEENALSLIDPLLDAVREHPAIQPDRLYEEARWLAEHGAHRNVVKFGIALLGLLETEQHHELILTLAKHDEFTLYAAVAIRNISEQANEQLYKLASQVHGWGRIHVVERLEPARQEIRDWLLREGFRNNVMYEYLAYECAHKGELHTAIAVPHIDQELFDGAGDILSALLAAGGPAESIDDYEHAAMVIGNYLRHAKTMCTTVKHFTIIMDIADFLGEEDDSWEARYEYEWTPELRKRYASICQQMMDDPQWVKRVEQELLHADSPHLHCAIRAARMLALDVWPVLFDQLSKKPVKSNLYFELIKTEDEQRARKLVDFAEKHLPLGEIASGPADVPGFGPEYEAHQCLGVLLQLLSSYEGVGQELVAAGLWSPVISNRHAALHVLKAWPSEMWGVKATEHLRRLSVDETEESIREQIREIL